MRKSRKKRPRKPLIPYYRTNERIKAQEIRLIDENGAMVGIVKKEQALAMAEEVGLDLIEISPKAQPPVCKIMDYGSFKYQREKESRAQKQKQKATEMKGIRLSLRIGKHDKEVRLKQAKKFLGNNNKIKIELILKGRERQYINQAKENMNAFIKELGEEVKIEQSFARQGGRLSIVITPEK